MCWASVFASTPVTIKCTTKRNKMTEEEGYLTTRQIARLAPVISISNMETIALGYLGLEEEWIESLRVEKKDQPDAFNRAVLRKWANKNSTPKQVKVQYLEMMSCHSCYHVIPLQF